VPDSVVVLTVHGIGAPKRSLDPGEDRTWVTVDQFERVLDVAVGRRDVRLTFDDGNESDVELALPRLLERSLTAEFFLLAGRIGRSGSVDEAGVRALLAAGMSVGSHGWDHVDWRRLGGDSVAREIVEAPRRLAELTGRPVRRVAIPFGSYDRVVLSRLKEAGMERVYTSDGGRSVPGRWVHPRTSLHDDLTQAAVAGLVDPPRTVKATARRAAARAVKRWRPAPG